MADSDSHPPRDDGPAWRNAAEGDSGRRVAADDAFPAVEPPGMNVIMQLFLIPLMIVMIIAAVVFTIDYLAHMGTNPQDLVAEIEKLNDGSWQKASALADLLNNPQNEELKHDRELAGRIAAMLDREITEGSIDENRLQLRMFLCLVLGEFRVDTGLPALLRAAETNRTPEDLPIQRTALESLSALIANLGPEKVEHNARLEQVLMGASRSGATDEIRQTAAFALGVLGTDAARDQLVLMLNDQYPNVRFNAAAALARQGDARAERRLIEMLDPHNERAFTKEDLEGKRPEEGRRWKRALVLSNGIKASVMLSTQNPSYDDSKLKARIEALLAPGLEVDSEPLPAGVKLQAKEALLRMADQ